MGLIDSIIGAESGGNPNATNPNSSAAGPGQFIDSTWLSTIKAARPDLAAGKSDADLLALKTDPDLSRQMTEAYAQQNQVILQKNGLPVTPGNTYLAHFAGPQGAVSVLQADPSRAAGDVLGAAVVKANPFLANMTVGELRAWADRKMGGGAPRPIAPQPAPSPANPAIAPQQGSPIFAQPAQAAPQAAPDPSLFTQLPAQTQPMQIQYARPHQVDLTRLRAQLAQAPIFPKG